MKHAIVNAGKRGHVDGRQVRITREGAMSVVLSSDHRQVLLLRREVFILWDLPGGGIEKHEEPVEAAVREAHEETGYQIAIERFVGLYAHQSVYGPGDQLTHAFRGRVVGGKARPFNLESTGLRWFPVTRLPRGLQPLHRQIIADALSEDAAPFERYMPFSLWKLYPARVVFLFLRWMNNLVKKIIRAH